MSIKKKVQILSFLFNEDELNKQDDIGIVQLMQTGTYFHGLYGNFEITPETFQKMKKNFDANIRKVKLAVDYFHDSSGIAAGWIKEVELRENDTQLWIHVEWTPEGERRIRDKELRYLSADFSMNHTNEDEKGDKFDTFGPTLYGAGLTNRPFIKGMKKILSERAVTAGAIKENLISQGYKFSMDFDTIVESLADLTDDEKGQIIQMLGGKLPAESDDKNGKGSQMSEEAKKLSDLQSKVTKLTENTGKLEKALSDSLAENETLKREQEFTTLLAEGNVVPAQKDAFMAGDMAKFAADAVDSNAVNLDEKGSEGGNNDGKDEGDKNAPENAKTQEEAEEAVSTLVDAKLSANKDMDYGDAVSIVLSEHPKLAEIYEGGK